jgi:hypothetical protein
MFIWQYIDIDPSEVNRIQELCMKVMPLNFKFFQELKLEVDEFIGMKIAQPVLIQSVPLKVGKIHIDSRSNNNILALQIPLINCENSITEFWHSDYPVEPTLLYSDKHEYQYIPREYCKKIDEFQLTKPLIFRTDIPHSVTNNSLSVRKAISLRFYTDPWHLINI